MDLRNRTITAPWIWLNGRFCANIQIQIDQDGRIASILQKENQREEWSSGLICLDNLALIPGFVNAHSHAFHRFLRGRSQIGNLEADNFWKWRQNMYKLVENINFETLKNVVAGAFTEMLLSGITTVGEFHYVHHAGNDDGRYSLDLAVAEAAREVGIRLVLIETLYMRAGFNQQTIQPEQWRFASRTVDEFLEHVEKMNTEIGKENYNGLVTLALAVHSLRAVPLIESARLFQFAATHRFPLHIHLEEQPGELADCRTFNEGRLPSELLFQDVIGDEKMNLGFLTAVHCTHTPRPLMDKFARRGANICICPTTEGYLGDGIPVLDAVDHLCLGTDCNNRISILEEMRWMSFCQNMRTNSRNCAGLTAQKLLVTATKNGAKSLGIDKNVGEFSVGKYLDFIAIDLHSPRLNQFMDSGGNLLLDAIIFSAGNAEILMSVVGGQVRFRRSDLKQQKQ